MCFQDFFIDLEKSRNLRTTTSTNTSTNPDMDDAEMGDLTKDFSECANSFRHTSEKKTLTELLTTDESAKDCL